MLAFWLVLNYEPLEDSCIDDVITCLLYLTNGFYVDVRLFSDTSQNMSKCGKNINDDTLGYRLMCHFFVLATFWRHLWSITGTDARQRGIYLLSI